MNWSEFFNMGGYALYVWVSYGLGMIVILANIIIPMQRNKKIIRDLVSRQRRSTAQ